MEHKTIELKREELYEKIWSQPTTILSKQFGLSDVGLAKTCKRFNIPRPPRGYWRRKTTGKKVSVPPLPYLKQGYPSIIRFVIKQSPSEASIPEGTDAEKMIAFEKLTVNQIKVTADHPISHPSLIETEQSLRDSKTNSSGMLMPKSNKLLDISVSPPQLDRALRIMESLITAFTTRGWQFMSDPNDKNSTCVTILDEILYFGIEEKTDRTERPLTKDQIKYQERNSWSKPTPNYDYFPSGSLVIKIKNSINGVRHAWSDGGKQKVEKMLNSFVIGLIKVSLKLKQDRIEEEKRKKEHEEWKRKSREEEMARYEESQKIRSLEESMAAWKKSQDIRAYLNSAREMVIKRDGSISPGGKIDTWLKWGERYADKIDPLV